MTFACLLSSCLVLICTSVPPDSDPFGFHVHTAHCPLLPSLNTSNTEGSTSLLCAVQTQSKGEEERKRGEEKHCNLFRIQGATRTHCMLSTLPPISPPFLPRSTPAPPTNSLCPHRQLDFWFPVIDTYVFYVSIYNLGPTNERKRLPETASFTYYSGSSCKHHLSNGVTSLLTE